jgi:predicted nucleic acid-binding protein
MRNELLRILIDTNIFIHREDYGIVPKELQELSRLLKTLKAELLIHPKSVDEIKNDSNKERQKINLSKIHTYPILESPPDPSLDIYFLNNVGTSSKPHDKIDNFLLYSVYRNAVNYLISEDRELQKKAARFDLNNRVFSIQEANDFFQRFLPKQKITYPPPLNEDFVYNLDITDPFFDTLKREYPKFENWLKRISAQGRKCYVHYQKKHISALLIPKVETEAILCNPPLPAKERLKLCLVKVERSGNRIGELFIKIGVKYCVQNNIDEMYLTHYTTDEDYLTKLLSKFGFFIVGKNPKGEDVYLKCLVPKSGVNKSLSPVEIGKRYYPTFYDGEDVRKFVVPIFPEYHDRLFTDALYRLTTLPEYCGDFVVEGNTISKVYLSHARITEISKGDILLFYRSHDRKELTTLGVLEEVHRIKDPHKIAEKVGNRTIYSFKEIQDFAQSPTLILLFRWHFYLPKPLNFNKLKELKVLKGAPRTITKIEHKGYLQIKKESKLDERYIVN